MLIIGAELKDLSRSFAYFPVDIPPASIKLKNPMKFMKSQQSPHNHTNFAKAIALGLGLAVSGLSLHSVQAQTTWDGGGGTNVLNTNTNWTTDTLPTTSATWAGTPSGSLSLLWNANFGDGATGISLNVNAGQTGSLSLDAANGTAALNISGINVASGRAFNRQWRRNRGQHGFSGHQHLHQQQRQHGHFPIRRAVQ